MQDDRERDGETDLLRESRVIRRERESFNNSGFSGDRILFRVSAVRKYGPTAGPKRDGPDITSSINIDICKSAGVAANLHA